MRDRNAHGRPWTDICNLLTLTNRNVAAPVNTRTRNLTSSVRLSNQPVPGVRQRGLSVVIISRYLSFAVGALL